MDFWKCLLTCKDQSYGLGDVLEKNLGNYIFYSPLDEIEMFYERNSKLLMFGYMIKYSELIHDEVYINILFEKDKFNVYMASGFFDTIIITRNYGFFINLLLDLSTIEGKDTQGTNKLNIADSVLTIDGTVWNRYQLNGFNIFIDDISSEMMLMIPSIFKNKSDNYNMVFIKISFYKNRKSNKNYITYALLVFEITKAVFTIDSLPYEFNFELPKDPPNRKYGINNGDTTKYIDIGERRYNQKGSTPVNDPFGHNFMFIDIDLQEIENSIYNDIKFHEEVAELENMSMEYHEAAAELEDVAIYNSFTAELIQTENVSSPSIFIAFKINGSEKIRKTQVIFYSMSYGNVNDAHHSETETTLNEIDMPFKEKFKTTMEKVKNIQNTKTKETISIEESFLRKNISVFYPTLNYGKTSPFTVYLIKQGIFYCVPSIFAKDPKADDLYLSVTVVKVSADSSKKITIDSCEVEYWKLIM